MFCVSSFVRFVSLSCTFSAYTEVCDSLLTELHLSKRHNYKLKSSKHCKRDGPSDQGVRTQKLTSFVDPSNAVQLSRFLGMKGMKSSLSQQEKGVHFSISDNVKHDLHDQNFPYLPTYLPPFYKRRVKSGATFPLAQ